MFSKEEAKIIRLEFWSKFEEYTASKRKRSHKPSKWVMNHTNIRQLKLKFHFDEKEALVGIDAESRNLDKRIDLFDKLEKLKKILEERLKQDLIWDLEYILPSGKSISRCYLKMDNVSIYIKKDWNKVMIFFYNKMSAIEDVFLEYKDFLKY